MIMKVFAGLHYPHLTHLRLEVLWLLGDFLPGRKTTSELHKFLATHSRLHHVRLAYIDLCDCSWVSVLEQLATFTALKSLHLDKLSQDYRLMTFGAESQ